MNFLKIIAKSILKEEIDTYESTIEKLKENQIIVNAKEEELNSKYPKADLTYSRIETDGTYKIALQNFFQINDFNIPTCTGNTDDEKALNCLKYIIKTIKYVPDKTDYGYDEYWAYPYQTLGRKKGDCEDGSILLANMLVKSGIPYWKIRLTAGDVNDSLGNAGGHCFVVYYCEEKKKWVILDWCYYQDSTTSIADRKEYKEMSYYKNIWFSWNQKYCFSNETFKTDINKKFRRKKC